MGASSISNVDWIKRNGVLFAFIVFAAAAIFVVRADARSYADSVRQDNIDACIRASRRVAFQAAFAAEAAAARRADGNSQAADFYDATAQGLLGTLARPPRTSVADMGHVVRVREADGVTRVVLTPLTRSKQRAGCFAAYKAN